VPSHGNRWKITLHDFFRELNSTIFHRFLAAFYDSVLSFFPARQVSEIFVIESSKSTENALIESLQKDTTKYFLKSKVYVVKFPKLLRAKDQNYP
jgi:hypothetical protein